MADNPLYQTAQPLKKLVLASQSPRRKELLTGLNVTFSVRKIDVDEDFPEDMPHDSVATFLADKKAMAALPSLSDDELLITADTVVLVKGQLLNKPATVEEAQYMLSLLSGSKHQVITGVCLMDRHKKVVIEDAAWVHFTSLSPAEIDFYIEKYRPFDKAGGYGVQDWIGYVAIEKIEGSFYTIMGLPVHKVYRELVNW